MKMIEHHLEELTTQAPTPTQLRATSFNPNTLPTTENSLFDTKNHNTVVKGGLYITRSLTHISITKYVLEFMINL